MLEIETIAPPSGWPCITALARCETSSGARRFISTILLWNFGEASAVSAKGAPPALLTTTSSLPWRSTIVSISSETAASSRMSQVWNSYGRPSTGRRAQVTTVAPSSAKTALIPAPTPRTPPVTSTTLPASPKFHGRASPAPVTLLAYQASACLGSDPRKTHMTITSATVEPGIVAVTVDYPPVNAIPSAGWFELADVVTAAGNDTATHVVILRAEGRGFNAGVDIKEMQRAEGFTALIDANRGCFAAFRAVYECAVPVVAAV